MLNRKRIFAIVLFVLIGLFVYTFANPAEDLEPLDNDTNVEDVDKNTDDETDDEDVIQLPDQNININPQVVAVNYGVLRTAVDNGNAVINLETEDEDLNNLLEQLETATNSGQQLITNQINDQNLVNNGATTINQLLVQINALLTGNLNEAIEAGNDLLDGYPEELNLNPNLIGLLEDLIDAIEEAGALQNPTAQQMLDAATEILDMITEIEEFQADLDIINDMVLDLVPSTTDWTNQDITLTAEINIEDLDLIDDVTIVRGDTCGLEENPTFSSVFESLVMEAINTEDITVSENDDYTACVTFLNGEERSVTYNVGNIDKKAPTIKLDSSNYSDSYRPLHRRAVKVNDQSDLSGINTSTLKYLWTLDKNIDTNDETFKTFTNNGSSYTDLWTPAGLTGTHYLVVVAEDNAGNKTVLRTNGFRLDNTAPEVTFDTLSDTTPAKSHSTIVRATDVGSETFSTLKYQWTETEEEPTLASFSGAQTFANNSEISTPADANGTLYLWVLVVDNSQNYNTGEYPNYVIEGTGAFVLDNTKPTIEIKLAPKYSGASEKTTGSNPYSLISFKLTDNYGVKESTLNSVLKSYTISKWTDLNGVKVGSYGGVYGKNVLVVRDVAGNETTLEFNLDNIAPEIEFVRLYGTDGNVYQKLNGIIYTVFTTNEPLQYLPKVTMGGQEAYSVRQKEGELNKYEAHFKVLNTTPEGVMTFKIEAYDVAGNQKIVETNTIQDTKIIIDKTKPAIEIKLAPKYSGASERTVGSNPYSLISFKLTDNNGVKESTLNDVLKQYTVSRWTDLNGVKVGSYGGVYGNNVLVLRDVAGNETTLEFSLDNVLPKVESLTQQYENGKIKVTVQYSEPVRGFTVGDLDDTYWRDLGGNLYYRYYAGTQSATLNFEDLASNPNSYTFDVDNTAPVLTVQYTDLVLENGRDYDLLTGVSTDDPNATIVATVNGDVITNSNQLPVGLYIVTYTATDTIGNPATTTVPLTVKVDFNINLHHDEGSWWFITWDISALSFTNLVNIHSGINYSINKVELVDLENNVIDDLGTIKTIDIRVRKVQGLELTREEYDLLVSGNYHIKVTYNNNILALSNLTLYHSFQ